jgi:hypothetical protein
MQAPLRGLVFYRLRAKTGHRFEIPNPLTCRREAVTRH